MGDTGMTMGLWIDIAVGLVVLIMLADLEIIRVKVKEIDMALETLKEAIEHATNVQSAAITLIKELADRINNMAQRPDAEELRRLAHELRSRADELAGAIAEHAEEDEEGEAETRRK